MNLNWRAKAVSPVEVVSLVRNGQHIFVHGACATPLPLINALAERQDIEGVSLYHLHLSGDIPLAAASVTERIRSVSLFASAGLRDPIAEGRADFVPVFLSDVPGLFSRREIPLDVAIVQLSPPDRHGYCSLGTSVDAARSAIDSASIILAEINEQMPRTLGYSFVHISKITAFTISNRPLAAHKEPVEGPVESAIGNYIADLIDDGSTLQMGIGGIPDSVLKRLQNKHDLGIHTEMFSDGVIPLIESGVITNRLKKVHPGRTVTSFVVGSQKLFDFVNDNPSIEFHPCDRTNDTALIRKNNKVVAINSALQIDLSGQVCADSLGHRIYSGIGGQMDFLRGAALSNGGKPIIALPSTAASGQISRLVPTLTPGAGVVTSRGHVHWVVTEYGAVNLHGKTLRERAQLLISIAHPDFRSELERDIREIRHFC
jgi:4-hydroxybutyrate CoA-transferase